MPVYCLENNIIQIGRPSSFSQIRSLRLVGETNNAENKISHFPAASCRSRRVVCVCVCVRACVRACVRMLVYLSSLRTIVRDACSSNGLRLDRFSCLLST